MFGALKHARQASAVVRRRRLSERVQRGVSPSSRQRRVCRRVRQTQSNADRRDTLARLQSARSDGADGARPMSKITAKILPRTDAGNDPNDHRDDRGYLNRAEPAVDGPPKFVALKPQTAALPEKSHAEKRYRSTRHLKISMLTCRRTPTWMCPLAICGLAAASMRVCRGRRVPTTNRSRHGNG